MTHYAANETIFRLEKGDTYLIGTWDGPPEMGSDPANDHSTHTATVMEVRDRKYGQSVHVRCTCGKRWSWANELYGEDVRTDDDGR